MISICESCTDKCSVKKVVAHCDCYKGPLENVKYDGDIELYEKDLKREAK